MFRTDEKHFSFLKRTVGYMATKPAEREKDSYPVDSMQSETGSNQGRRGHWASHALEEEVATNGKTVLMETAERTAMDNFTSNPFPQRQLSP